MVPDANSDPRPEDYQPRLSWWSHVWRAALMLLIGAVVWATVMEQQSDLERTVDIGVGLFAFVLVWWRRRFPLTIAMVTCLVSVVSAWAAGPATLAAVSVATRRDWRQLALLFPANLVCAEIFSRMYPVEREAWWVTLLTNSVFLGAMFGWGLYIGSRRELLWNLRSRAERAEAERELRATQSRLAERGRIAREMHDVLAHRISQISMRAGAMHYRDDLDAAALREEAGVIRETAHQALTDLRQVLGVLRDSAGEPLDRPQPTFADLPALVDEAREAGQRVTFIDDVAVPDGAQVPQAVGRTLYRIVQESLTNARKHAPDSTTRVRISGDPDRGIELEARNPLGFGPSTTPGAGLGLTGLVERAELAGGRLTAGVEGAEFVVTAWLPWAP